MSTAARRKLNINFNPDLNKVDKVFFDMLEDIKTSERGDVYRQSLLAGLLLRKKYPDILKTIDFVCSVNTDPTWEHVENIMNIVSGDLKNIAVEGKSTGEIMKSSAETVQNDKKSDSISEQTKENAKKYF